MALSVGRFSDLLAIFADPLQRSLWVQLGNGSPNSSSELRTSRYPVVSRKELICESHDVRKAEDIVDLSFPHRLKRGLKLLLHLSKLKVEKSY